MYLQLTNAAITYTISHIMQVAAPALSYKWEYAGDSGLRIICQGPHPLHIFLDLLDLSQYKQLIEGTFPTHMMDSFDGQIQIPVFLKNAGTPFIEEEGADSIEVHGDVITVSFLLLSRKEEQLIPDRDAYGRFPYEASLCARYSFVDCPIIDEWAMLLRQAISKKIPSEQLGTHRPTLRPTHDMDNLRRFPGVKTAMRSIVGGDLLLRKNPGLAVHSLLRYFKSKNDPMLDPCIEGGEKLLQVSLENRLCSEFYFMGLEAGEEDVRYDVRIPSGAAFAQKVREEGMVCGFHPSRLTIRDENRFLTELQRVKVGIGEPIVCGRQHYLGFDVERTPRFWESGAMQADSTLGFARREGFRCGTCHPFPLYDLHRDTPLSVTERPLIAMDVTLRERGLSPEQALCSLQRLFSRTKAVCGDFVILWHNDNAVRDWSGWFSQVYVPFIRDAASQLA